MTPLLAVYAAPITLATLTLAAVTYGRLITIQSRA